MDAFAATSTLDANLACLGELNADVEAAVRAAAPALLEWSETPAGEPTAMLGGRSLCSRHHPLEEADRIVGNIDLVEHAVVAVMGLGLGYHVRRLAERLGKAGVVIVFEPDVALIRAVFERIDLTPWLRQSLVVWVVDPDDRAALARKLHNTEAIIAQGLHVLEHPASRERLGDRGVRFGRLLGELVSNAKTTLLTTLVRSVDTVRNLLSNLDHYAAGAGIADLAGTAEGRLGIVVSAGPSLQRNMHLLAAPGVRDRCVIVATQTTLRPLLAAGVRPHFVTALDYHEISRRFYEGLDADDVADTTLVADPKANPVILDAFPGTVRCCASGFLDRVLGPLARPMGELPAGATVAHLAYALARFLGCDPVALIGQDLGFTDGLYYARGTAIDDVWAPELNPFNTIEMMEWQRIVRHKLLLKKVVDVHGRSVYTDQQMLAYLQQFERIFAADQAKGLAVIDASEGGVAKAHTTVRPLADVLETHARKPLPSMPTASRKLDPRRLEQAARRVGAVATEVRTLRESAEKAASLIGRMIEDQRNARRMDAHFEKLDALRKRVEERMEAFELLNQLNQLGAFKRFKADRRLHMLELEGGQDAVAHQRAQLERDLVNVQWMADGGREFEAQLARTEAMLAAAAAGRAFDRSASDAEAAA
ncbi:MAG: DUF115 domain-containing protein, partial [Phycisphaerales bacterium]|nr:DUF115 domain-containing protein [Phycisphaerales bacterium]